MWVLMKGLCLLIRLVMSWVVFGVFVMFRWLCLNVKNMLW